MSTDFHNDVWSNCLLPTTIDSSLFNSPLVEMELNPNDNIIYFKGITTQSTFEKMIEGLSNIESINMKKDLLITAYKNRTIQNNYLHLYIKLLESEITEDSFEKVINDQSEKYIIDINKIPTVTQLDVLSSLLIELNEDFDTDDVSELFSFDLSNAIEDINSSKMIL